MRGRAALALLSGLLAASRLGAAEARVAVAFPAGGPVTIDGRLDEPAWAGATPIGELVQSEPDEGVPPTEATEVRVLPDGEALYFGIRCFDRTPSGIAATKMGRDAELGGGGGSTCARTSRGARRTPGGSSRSAATSSRTSPRT